MFAKTVFQSMHFRRLYGPFREQAKRRPVRSYGLRPESKADFYITISAERGDDHDQRDCSHSTIPNPAARPLAKQAVSR